MQTILQHTAPALDTPADDSAWSKQFDAAKSRYQATLRKPAVEASTIGDLDDPNFYATHAWTPQLAAARLAAVKARHEANVVAMDAGFAAELLEAVACVECQETDDQAESDPSEWPAWTDEVVVSEPLSTEEIIRGVPHYGTDGPSVPAGSDQVASAWHNGWTLGESGFEVHQVAPPEFMTGREADAFIHGVEVGAAERWADYGRFLAERDAMVEALRIDDLHDGELMEARMIRA